MTEQEAAVLRPILKRLPRKHLPAAMRHLYRLEGGAVPTESMQAMFREFGCSETDARARVDAAASTVLDQSAVALGAGKGFRT